jgi:hypothetical protein
MLVKKMSIKEFQTQRKQQYECVVNHIVPVIESGRNVFVTAPVKSGKRELVEIYALLTKGSYEQEHTHFYICNLDRKDCKDQIEELEAYGIISMIGRDIRKTLNEKLKVVEQCLLNGHKIIFHIDESDYGTGYKQALADLLIPVFNKKGVHFIFYSATNEEVLFSDLKEKGEQVSFLPAETYCGYDFFLDRNLVQNANPFFNRDMSLSNQAIDICNSHAQSKKPIGVIRLTTKENKEDPLFRKFFRDCENNGKARKQLESIYAEHGKDLTIVFADKDHSFHWGLKENYPGNGFNHYIMAENCFLLVIINQTSTRSTQWRCHNKIFFYHSFRKMTTNANTILQADARCVHYNSSNDLSDSEIKIYGDIDVFMKYAGRMTNQELNDTGRNLSARIQTTSKKDYEYKVKILVEGNDDFEILPLTRNGSMQKIKVRIDDEIRILTPQSVQNNGNRIRNPKSDNSNLAKYIHTGKQGLADVTKNCALIDGPQTNAQLGPDNAYWFEDWTNDWNIMLYKYPQIKPALDLNKKVYAFWYRVKKDNSIITANSSIYQNLD